MNQIAPQNERERQKARYDNMKEREYKCHKIVRIKTKHINNA